MRLDQCDEIAFLWRERESKRGAREEREKERERDESERERSFRHKTFRLVNAIGLE
jgi:hypothetical protein